VDRRRFGDGDGDGGVLTLKIQFAEVESALEGALIRSGTISEGYNHVIPSQPMAKKVLNTKRNTAAAIPKWEFPG
jgi:hypothetical protein